MKGRLNVFQASMLRWRELHPYIAVHVIRVARRLDVPRLQAVLDDHRETLGLTGLQVDRQAGRYEYTGGRIQSDLRIIPAGSDALATLSAEIERQLNLPFAQDGRIDPFRFLAVDGGEAFHLGVAYDHFIAGGDSIVILLKGLWERYTGVTPVNAHPALELYPPTFRPWVLRHPGRLLRGMQRPWELLASCRRAFRPRYEGTTDLRNGFACVRLDDSEVGAFVQKAKAWGVTQNDLLIALLLQTLSPFADERRSAKRRNELAVASIINLRADVGNSAVTTFGQFLSSFRVSHRTPPGIGLRQVAQDVHEMTTRIRTTRRYFQTLLAMQMTAAIWHFLSPERRTNFHGKNYPLWAGTTPLNVNALWKEAGGGEPVPEYLRGVSTGPVAPLVLASTTAGGAIYLGASYRTAAFSRENIAKIMSEIRHLIQTS